MNSYTAYTLRTTQQFKSFRGDGNKQFVSIDEINDKTPYDLKIQPWKDYSDWKTRIRVRKKESEESKIIQQIQFYGLQQGKLLQEQRIKELLTQLLDSKSA
jgi:hypothetical protein